MNEPCFTAYPEEKEILLDDGIPFQVTDVAKPVNNDEYLEKYGRDLHIVTMQSKLAMNHVQVDCPSTLKTKCSLYEFFKNGNRPPAKGEEDYPALYLSTFMNEAKDIVYGGRYPPKNKRNDNPTQYSSEKNGSYACVTSRKEDAFPIWFHKITEWDDKDILLKQKKKEHLGHNSFKISTER